MNVSDPPPILIKASREGFTLVPDPAASFDAVLAYLEQRLRESLLNVLVHLHLI